MRFHDNSGCNPIILEGHFFWWGPTDMEGKLITGTTCIKLRADTFWVPRNIFESHFNIEVKTDHRKENLLKVDIS